MLGALAMTGGVGAVRRRRLRAENKRLARNGRNVPCRTLGATRCLLRVVFKRRRVDGVARAS